MGPDLRIDWVEVCANPDDYEKLVKLLLQRLYEDGEVIDGRGGDGGREFQIRVSDGVIFFEAKSFTGRLTPRNPKRRAQVERSLASTARNNPMAWRLVVPIDHNQSELEWFDGLRAGAFPFIDRWHGQTWLEEQLARHPDLVRYATQNKLLDYVRQYNLETAALAGGAVTLLERHRALAELADEVHPYWRPVVARMPDGSLYSSVEAKRPDAAEQAPIIFTVGVAIPHTPEHDELREALRSGFELGAGAQIPGQFIWELTASGPPGLGLPTGEIPDLVEFVAVPDTDARELPTQTLAVYEPEAAYPLASLTFHPAQRTTGSAGARLTAFDTARTVKLVTDIRAQTIRLNLQAQDPRPIVPAALLPGLRFSCAVRPPNRLVLTIRKDGQRYTEESIIDHALLSDHPDERLVQFIEDLAAIQDALNDTFPMPDTFTGRDAHEARQLRRLLDGERVPWMRGPLTVTLEPDRIEEFRAQFTATPTGWLRISYDDIEVEFDGHVVHSGPVYLLGQMSVDLDAIVLDPDDRDGAPTAAFEVLGDGWMHAERGRPDDQGTIGSERSARSGRVAVSPNLSPDVTA
jgi:hypothetical protein